MPPDYHWVSRAAKWLAVAVVIFVILVAPIIPSTKIVYVNGNVQTVTSTVQYSTAFQVYTTTSSSQISVYTGSYLYLSNYSRDYYYYCSYCCYWYNQIPICNYLYWPWYEPKRQATVTISAAQQVVSVTKTPQPMGLETLTLTYYNGQSITIQNVYHDNLTQNGTITIPSIVVATNTIVNTATTPVTETVPCYECVPEHVTEYVSILQLLFGY